MITGFGLVPVSSVLTAQSRDANFRGIQGSLTLHPFVIGPLTTHSKNLWDS